jgi:regulator of nucleoside diphosphate kinase
MPGTIIVSDADMNQLEKLVESRRGSLQMDQEHIAMLDEELGNAQVLSPREVPPDVVTMNSRVRVTDIRNGRSFACQVVFPKDADLDKSRISILAPLGTALLGERVGSEVAWKCPGGTRRLRIEALEYQPERDGTAVQST